MVFRAIPLIATVMLGLIVLGTILLIVSLSASEKGRTLLKAVLVVPGVFLVIVFLALFGYRAALVSRHEAIAIQHQGATEEIRDNQLIRLNQPTGRLSGTITCNKRPLPRGTIRLAGGIDRPMPVLQGDIVKGRYSFSKLPSGSYRVEVTAFRVTGGTESEEGEVESLEAEQYLPKKYNDQSELRLTVVPGKNDFDLDLNVDLDQELAHGKVPIALAMADGDKIGLPERRKPATAGAERPPGAADLASEIAAADEEVAAALSAAVAPAEEPDAAGESAPAGDLPDWVGAAPHKVKGVYRMPVEVGPFSTREECDQELPKTLQAAIDQYAATYLGPRARGQIRLPLDYVKSKIIKTECEQHKEVQISPEGQIPEQFVDMLHLHVLLEFDRAANARIEEEWGKVVVAERLYGVGALGVLVFVLLGSVWSYLRIDLATGGAYRGRLRLVAATLFLIAIVVGLMLVRMGSYIGSV